MRDQLLAGAGLSKDANASLGGSDALHLRHDFLHGVTDPDDFVLPKALAKLAVLRLEPLQPERVFNRQQQFFG